MSAIRGCGSRVVGGVYAEVKTGDEGVPIEAFLVDPPSPVDAQALGLIDKGVRLIQLGDTWHVFDIIGENYYPNVADFVEEGRRMGVSRRLSSNLDFSKIDPEKSRLVLLHRRAIISNVEEAGFLNLSHICPKGIAEHEEKQLQEMCAGLWWHDLSSKHLDTSQMRELKSGARYKAWLRPKGSEKPERTLGIFMTLPISNLTVIKGRNAEENARVEKIYQTVASKSKLPVTMEEE
jgi:hypothetical protein